MACLISSTSAASRRLLFRLPGQGRANYCPGAARFPPSLHTLHRVLTQEGIQHELDSDNSDSALDWSLLLTDDEASIFQQKPPADLPQPVPVAMPHLTQVGEDSDLDWSLLLPEDEAAIFFRVPLVSPAEESKSVDAGSNSGSDNGSGSGSAPPTSEKKVDDHPETLYCDSASRSPPLVMATKDALSGSTDFAGLPVSMAVLEEGGPRGGLSATAMMVQRDIRRLIQKGWAIQRCLRGDMLNGLIERQEVRVWAAGSRSRSGSKLIGWPSLTHHVSD